MSYKVTINIYNVYTIQLILFDFNIKDTEKEVEN